MVNDTLADSLTRIRNAITTKKSEVKLPFSKMVLEVCNILKENKFLKDVEVVEEGKSKKKGSDFVFKSIKISLNYNETPDQRVINSLEKVSKPGVKVYKPVSEIKKTLDGYGITIVSTSKGIMTDKDARKNNTGGEILCKVY